MWNIERVLGTIGYVACNVIGAIKFGYSGISLVLATFMATSILLSSKHVEYDEDDEHEHDSCVGCKHNLGGGLCKINLECECREGGGYEAWED